MTALSPMTRLHFLIAFPITLAGVLWGTRPVQAYTVQPGDTLWSLSQRSGVPVDQLARQNGIADPNHILVGQQLTLAPAAPTAVYTVRPGDTLWAIAQRFGVSVADLERLNGVSDPRRLLPGQVLRLGVQRGPEAVSGAAARQLLLRAAEVEQVDPNLVLAVSLWESGYNNSMISRDGAVGLMQILPSTAAWAGPSLLGRQVDIYRAWDNALLGAALLRHYLEDFKGDVRLALAAYYQGESATRRYGIYPSSRNYVNGILALRARLAASG